MNRVLLRRIAGVIVDVLLGLPSIIPEGATAAAQQSDSPALGAGGSAAGVGYSDVVSFEARRSALNEVVAGLGYGLVYGEVRGNVLLFRTPMAKRLSPEAWSTVAQIVSHELTTSRNPYVLGFFAQHTGDNSIRQIVIAESI